MNAAPTVSTHEAQYLDSGFYTVTDAAATALCSILGQKLPKDGHEKFVMLETEHGHKLNAWLSRADVRSGIMRQSPRGWLWSIHGLRFDGAGHQTPITLGKSFSFRPLNSTL